VLDGDNGERRFEGEEKGSKMTFASIIMSVVSYNFFRCFWELRVQFRWGQRGETWNLEIWNGGQEGE